MQATWKLNGLDVSLWLREGGVTYGEVHRQQRSIVLLDGTLVQKEVVKRTLGLSFMTLRDEKVARLEAALSSRPVTVKYTETNGSTASKLFYVMGFNTGVKTVRGGNTYWTDTSLVLEER